MGYADDPIALRKMLAAVVGAGSSPRLQLFARMPEECDLARHEDDREEALCQQLRRLGELSREMILVSEAIERIGDSILSPPAESVARLAPS